jgi:single-strand DNA-binding protein
MEKVMITGHLGQDAKMNVHANDEYASFSVGCNRRVNGPDGQPKDVTTWYNCTWWKPNKATQYLKKGQMVLVEGRPTARHYKDRNGLDKAVLEIQVAQVELLGKNPNADQSNPPAATAPAADGGDVNMGGGDLPF